MELLVILFLYKLYAHINIFKSYLSNQAVLLHDEKVKTQI